MEQPGASSAGRARAAAGAQGGRAGSWWRTVRVVGSIGSTNASLADAARAGAAEAALLVAEHQHAGRGRMGRSWQAPARSALTFSVLVRPQVPVADWPWLPLLTGVAVAEAIRRGAGVQAMVKWPNDVLVEDRKLAGVLLERVETPIGPAAVLGIGLNVSAQREELRCPRPLAGAGGRHHPRPAEPAAARAAHPATAVPGVGASRSLGRRSARGLSGSVQHP
jgi:BirA family biotin operon repressor/biotin-[acetyl-CoA-carboxylase] ligase